MTAIRHERKRSNLLSLWKNLKSKNRTAEGNVAMDLTKARTDTQGASSTAKLYNPRTKSLYTACTSVSEYVEDTSSAASRGSVATCEGSSASIQDTQTKMRSVPSTIQPLPVILPTLVSLPLVGTRQARSQHVRHNAPYGFTSPFLRPGTTVLTHVRTYSLKYTGSHGVRDVQLACDRLQRSGGCVVCFARGLVDWKMHKLSNCPRGLGTRKDPTWRVWRTDYLRIPPGSCSSCCIPQSAIGGWHEYRTTLFTENRCPTPDLVKPIAYALARDEALTDWFLQYHRMAVSFLHSYDTYASWLLKKSHPEGLMNILEAFLCLVDFRSCQEGFALD